MNYYLTQFLSGHGHFHAYLHKMSKVTDSGCVHCDALLDSVLYTLLNVHSEPMFQELRVIAREYLTVDHYPDDALR